MPIRFSISESGRDNVLEHLTDLSYRAFDLKPMADRAAVVMERQNADGAVMGIDKDGKSYKAVEESTWKRRPGSGPPLAPRDAGSRVVTEFRVAVEPGGFDAMIVRGSWPGIPWLGAHVKGGGRNHLPIRNPVGMRPHGMDQLRQEFHAWVQEILKGGPGSGPSVAPGTGGGGGPYPTTPPAGGGPAPAPRPATNAPQARAASAAPGATPVSARMVARSRTAARAAGIKVRRSDTMLDMVGRSRQAAKVGAARSEARANATGPDPSAEARYAGARVDYGSVGWTKTGTKYEAAVRDSIRQTFGRDMTPREIARLVGAPEDAVHIRIDTVGNASTGIDIDISSPSLRVMKRSIMARGGTGAYARKATTIHNDEIEVLKGHQGKGIATRIFSSQVEEASKAGFERIVTYAARDDGYNGYSTWPKLGYDGGIPDRVKAKLPREMAGAERVSELMATPEGRKFWDEHGTSTQMTFDLSPGSYSQRTLDAYLKAKGLR